MSAQAVIVKELLGCIAESVELSAPTATSTMPPSLMMMADFLTLGGDVLRKAAASPEIVREVVAAYAEYYRSLAETPDEEMEAIAESIVALINDWKAVQHAIQGMLENGKPVLAAFDKAANAVGGRPHCEALLQETTPMARDVLQKALEANLAAAAQLGDPTEQYAELGFKMVSLWDQLEKLE
jgi:hypothetical protein